MSTLQILEYVALGLGTTYIMYKCELFESLYRLIPKYIKILCPTAYVNFIDQIPTAPISPPVRRTIAQNEA